MSTDSQETVSYSYPQRPIAIALAFMVPTFLILVVLEPIIPRPLSGAFLWTSGLSIVLMVAAYARGVKPILQVTKDAIIQWSLLLRKHEFAWEEIESMQFTESHRKPPQVIEIKLKLKNRKPVILGVRYTEIDAAELKQTIQTLRH